MAYTSGNDEPVQTYKDMDYFGELALLYGCPRAATVRCTRAGRIWAVDRVVFRKIIMQQNMQVFVVISEATGLDEGDLRHVHVS